MATVTKLKAAVNNKNLPILGSDGNLYSYYVGRWQNTISKLGYMPTSQEIAALNTFTENGISNGWIDRVKYFMPFIGSEATPLTGIVPLIDDVSDYELAVDSVPTDLFSYANGKVICMGKNSSTNTNTALPFTSGQLGITDCHSFYIDVTYNSIDDIANGVKGYIIETSDDNGCYAGIRKGEANNARLIYVYKINPDSSAETSIIGAGTPTSEELPQEIGVFWARYTINDASYRKRFTLWQGETHPRSESTVESTGVYPTMQYSIGAKEKAIDIAVNVVGVLDPLISNSELYAFNNAVFDLTLALGRRSV